MRNSARNQFFGKVSAVKKARLMAEVTLLLKGKDSLVAHITAESLAALGLRKGDDAYALIKAGWVMLEPAGREPRVSASNRLKGRIEKVECGDASGEVCLRLAGGNTLIASVTRESAEGLALKEGEEVFAFFKAPSMILGVAR